MSETFMGVAVPGPESEAVIIGASMATTYPDRQAHASDGPAALRAAAQRLACFVGNHDFDSGRPFAGWLGRIGDGGDVNTVAADSEGNRRRIATVVGSAIAAEAMPVLLGGDDSVAEPFVAGWRDHGPITVVQIGAHLDFRDELMGERHGYGSAMRRASEMAWVRRVIHVGQGGVGWARPTDVQDSLDAGNAIVTARDLARTSVAAVVGLLDPEERVVVAYDVGGTDPADIPAVRAPSPGGPGLEVISDLVATIAAHGSLEGLVVTDFEPRLDESGRSAMGLAHIICRALDERLALP